MPTVGPSVFLKQPLAVWPMIRLNGRHLQIAAIALANDLTLVTHNTAEFSWIDGLRLIDWEI